MRKDEPQRREARDPSRGRVNRRRFLRGLFMGSAGLLAACTISEIAQEPAAFQTATPFRALESPQAPANQTPEAVPEGSISLEEFLQFSSLLTGVDNLDPALGRVYLNALQSGGGDGPSLADVYSAASSGSGTPPGDIESLNSAGFFEQEGMSSAADQIITMWYTGIYTQDGEDHVATFVDALAWKVLHFTKPPTICASFGFWAKEPRVEISPEFQYTPVPTQPAQENGGGGEGG